MSIEGRPLRAGIIGCGEIAQEGHIPGLLAAVSRRDERAGDEPRCARPIVFAPVVDSSDQWTDDRGAASAMTPEDVTFVVCVEPGKYEVQAALMVESLRLFGGRFANAPVIAITPRVGPALALTTRKRFEELGVVYLRRRHFHRAWQLFIGKVQALNDAEEIAATKALVLVDCDILFLGEPSGLLLAPGAAVGACPSDQGIVGTTGASSQFDPAWRRACAAVGLTIEDLSWVDPSDGSEPVRFYVNSGVVVMRNGYDVPSRWLGCMDDLLSHHVAFPGWGPYFVDQIALGLAITRFAIPFQRLAYTHNFGVDSSIPHAWQSERAGTGPGTPASRSAHARALGTNGRASSEHAPRSRRVAGTRGSDRRPARARIRRCNAQRAARLERHLTPGIQDARQACQSRGFR